MSENISHNPKANQTATSSLLKHQNIVNKGASFDMLFSGKNDDFQLVMNDAVKPATKPAEPKSNQEPHKSESDQKVQNESESKDKSATLAEQTAKKEDKEQKTKETAATEEEMLLAIKAAEETATKELEELEQLKQLESDTTLTQEQTNKIIEEQVDKEEIEVSSEALNQQAEKINTDLNNLKINHNKQEESTAAAEAVEQALEEKAVPTSDLAADLARQLEKLNQLNQQLKENGPLYNKLLGQGFTPEQVRELNKMIETVLSNSTLNQKNIVIPTESTASKDFMQQFNQWAEGKFELDNVQDFLKLREQFNQLNSQQPLNLKTILPVQQELNIDKKPAISMQAALQAITAAGKDNASINNSNNNVTPTSQTNNVNSSLMTQAERTINAATGNGKLNLFNQTLPLRDPQFAQSMVERVSYLLSHNITNARIDIFPPEHSPIQVNVNVSGDQTNVQFATHSSAARAELHNSMAQLNDMLQKFGLSLADVDISEQPLAQQKQSTDEGAEKGVAQQAAGDDESQSSPSDDDAITLVQELDGNANLIDLYI